MMASAQVVETSVNTNNSPSQEYTTKPDDQSNHNIDSPGFKPFTVINSNNYNSNNDDADNNYYTGISSHQFESIFEGG